MPLSLSSLFLLGCLKQHSLFYVKVPVRGGGVYKFVMSYTGGFNSAKIMATTQLGEQGTGFGRSRVHVPQSSIAVGFPSELGFVFTRNKFHFPMEGRGKN